MWWFSLMAAGYPYYMAVILTVVSVLLVIAFVAWATNSTWLAARATESKRHAQTHRDDHAPEIRC